MEDRQHPNNRSEIIYFTKARTALKYGLQSLGFQKNESILIPDFLCDSVISSIEESTLEFTVYETADDMSPIWASVELNICKNTKALLMVHYFGQPQNINVFRQFSKKHNLLLVEDNAHGHGGTYQNRMLGTFGDIGISSPRKFNECGGLLYLNNNYDKTLLPQLDYETLEKKPIWYKVLLNKYPTLKHQLKLLLRKRYKYENPRAFRAKPEEEFYLPKSNIQRLESLDWNHIANQRRERYLKLKTMAEMKGLKPVFADIALGSNPWCFAAYVENNQAAISWFNWGWRNNIETFSWPALREEQLTEEDKAFNRWKKIVCFNLS